MIKSEPADFFLFLAVFRQKIEHLQLPTWVYTAVSGRHLQPDRLKALRTSSQQPLRADLDVRELPGFTIEVPPLPRFPDKHDMEGMQLSINAGTLRQT